MDENPYSVTRSPSTNMQRRGSRIPKMHTIERAIIITSLVYMLGYIPYFLVQGYRIAHGVPVSPLAILPAHFLGMVFNGAAFVCTIRDLYLRSFSNPNTKLTWALLIMLTGGIGWLVYIFKYALKPR